MNKGTWEEIARLGPSLAGRRVRLTVLGEVEPSRMLDGALADLIAEAEKLSAQLPPKSGPEEPWGEEVVRKFRRQGFDL